MNQNRCYACASSAALQARLQACAGDAQAQFLRRR
nr:MAG TPA: hypothetical protein [Caudoviricetes sp.]